MFNDKRWICNNPERGRIKGLAEAMNIAPILAAALINRGINTKEEGEQFLYPQFSDLFDPFLMPDIKVSVERIILALEHGERICVYGDYDVDGITSVSLLMRILNAAGADAMYYIPNRVKEGYGLNTRAVHSIHKAGVRLIISADCGIASHDEIELCNEYGIDVIVTDHHLPSQGGLPPAMGIINPHRSDSEYPFNDLAGVGVAYKLCAALERLMLSAGVSINKEDQGALLSDEMLDLVALGTIADIVPLIGENRVLVSLGLKQMSRTTNTGLRALMRVSGIDERLINAGQVAFRLAPRLNAVGRISDAKKGVELLLEDNWARAVSLAKELDAKNRERQEIGNRIYKQAIEIANESSGDNVLVLGSEKWHPGVIGIAASRIAERFNKPAVLFQVGKHEARGSARGIPGLDLYRLLSLCEHYYENFGGHKQAAGLTIKSTDLEGFAREINSVAMSQEVKGLGLKGVLKAEADLTDIDITLRDVKELELLEPCGCGNPHPLFVKRHVKVNRLQRVGKGREHLKFVTAEGNREFASIAFQWKSAGWPVPGQRVDIIFAPTMNRWLGKTELQLMMEDIKGIAEEETFLRAWYKSLEKLGDRCDITLSAAMDKLISFETQNVKDSHPLLKDVFLNSTGNLLFLNGYKRVLSLVSMLSLCPNTEVYFSCLRGYSRDKNFIVIHPSSFEGMAGCEGRLYFYANEMLPGQLRGIADIEGIQGTMLVEEGARGLYRDLNDILPGRAEIATVYRLIKRKNGLCFNDVIKFALKKALASAEAMLAIEGLKSANLIKECNGHIYLMPPPDKKINIYEFPALNMIRTIVDATKDCMKINDTNIKSR